MNIFKNPLYLKNTTTIHSKNLILFFNIIVIRN